jgi:uncharacterized protein YidB (DUF937 family)
MGLLDDLLSSMAAGQDAGPQRSGRPPQPQSSGIDMNQVLMSLLPVVLAMMSQRRGGAAQSGGGPSMGGQSTGGGLGDLLGSLFGGAGGRGGLADLLSQLQRAGLGAQADSWVSRGANQPISPDAVEQVFGRDVLAQIARHAGVSEADASRGLSQLLPEVVDRVTPEGRVPEENDLLASVDAFTRRYAAR